MRSRVLYAALLVAASVMQSVVFADERPSPVLSATNRVESHSLGARPRICLALSGGGARGYAHIGVLKKLEALHVPIDCIAGTSMGAVIGGLYASGMSAAAIEKALAGMDLTDVAFDREARVDQPQAVRRDNFDYPVSLPLGFSSDGIRSASGLIQGNRLLALLQQHTSRLPGDVSFDDLPVPFRAVATDIETGDKIVLREGSLPQAIRASMAVPGLFAPVVLEGRTLVDGGIADNLPVDVAKQMGADIVIAVDIGTPLKRANQLTSMASVTQQVIGALISQNVRSQRANLGAADILLRPDLSGLAFTDFADAGRGIAAGAVAVDASQLRISALSLTPQAWTAYPADRNEHAFLPEGTKVDRVEVVVNGRVPASRVWEALRTKPGDLYDPRMIEQDVAALNSTSDFESVTDSLTGTDGDRVLRVMANSKSWGPNFLLFGVRLQSNFSGDGAFALRVGHRMPWITRSGLEWRNDAVLGSHDLMLKTELRQPLFAPDGVYLAPFASIKRNQLDVYDDDEPDGAPPMTKLRQQEFRVGLNAGLPLGKFGEIRAGIAKVHTSFALMTAAPIVINQLDGDESESVLMSPASSSETVGRVELEIDQIDDVLFPRHGYRVDGYAEMALDQSEGRYNTAHVRALWAASFGRHSLNAAFEAGGQFGNKDVGAYTFNLGGFQHLAAYAENQFYGNYVMYGRLTYLAQLKRFNSGPVRGTFAGASLEAGNVWNNSSAFARGPWRASASAFLGATSSFGPVYLGVAIAPGGVRNVYFQLGNQF